MDELPFAVYKGITSALLTDKREEI